MFTFVEKMRVKTYKNINSVSVAYKLRKLKMTPTKPTCVLSLHAKFKSPNTSPSGRKVKPQVKVNDKNNGHLLYVDTSRPRANSILS